MDIPDKLRAEIADERKLRHDLVMRKFSFLTAFIGAGAAKLVSESKAGLDFGMLLFLIPFIAIAFDLYIFLEDYRIKRAGEFLKRIGGHPATDDKQRLECLWEEFVAANPNKGAAYAFTLVTLIYTVASFMLLLMLGKGWLLLTIWIGLAAILEGWIARRHLKLRKDLEGSDFKISLANNRVQATR